MRLLEDVVSYDMQTPASGQVCLLINAIFLKDFGKWKKGAHVKELFIDFPKAVIHDRKKYTPIKIVEATEVVYVDNTAPNRNGTAE